MAPNPREGYSLVKLPDDYAGKVKVPGGDGRPSRFARPGETVELSDIALDFDPYLKSFKLDEKGKKSASGDLYADSSVEYMRTALKNHGVSEEGSRDELAARMGEYGLPPQESVTKTASSLMSEVSKDAKSPAKEKK